IKAGPCTPLPKADLPRYLPEFLGGVLHEARFHGIPYDVVHSHYWLSGWVGRAAKEVWDAPLVASFHTLGKVKNYSLARDERTERQRRRGRPPARARPRPRRGRARRPVPAADAAEAVGLLRGGRRSARPVPLGVVRTGRAGSGRMRNAGGRRVRRRSPLRGRGRQDGIPRGGTRPG